MQFVPYQILEAVGLATVSALWIGLACFAIAQVTQLYFRSPRNEYRMVSALLGCLLVGSVASFLVAATSRGTLEEHLLSHLSLAGDSPSSAAASSATTGSRVSFGPLGSRSIAASPWGASNAELMSAIMVLTGTVYLFGFAIASLKLTIQLAASERTLRRARKCTNQQVARVLGAVAQDAGLTSPPQLAVSDQLSQPVVVGLRCPTILLPPAFLTQLSDEEIHNVLLHEAIHIKRGDLKTQFLQRLIEVSLYFHPAVWWLSSRMTDRREYCCDAAVIDLSGKPLHYAKSLLQAFELGRASVGKNQRPTLASGLFDGSVSQLRGRVAFVLSEQCHHHTLGSLPRLLVVSVAIPACLFVASTAASFRPSTIDEYSVLAPSSLASLPPKRVPAIASGPVVPNLAALHRKHPNLADQLRKVSDQPRLTARTIQTILQAKPSGTVADSLSKSSDSDVSPNGRSGTPP